MASSEDLTETEFARAERDSVNGSLRRILSIVMGLALTNTIIVLVTHTHAVTRGAAASEGVIQALTALPIANVACALVLIATIVRFYHGNLRHFEHVHGRIMVAPEYARREQSLDAALGIDFFVILAEGVLFAVASFYARPRSEFLILVLVLLAGDIAWFLVTLRETATRDVLRHQVRWLANNFLAVLAIALCAYLSTKDSYSLWVDLGIGALAANTLADFYLSRGFYFPKAGAALGTPEGRGRSD
jgi:hypothetical protein